MSLRVAQKKVPTVAVPPMVVSLKILRMKPIVLSIVAGSEAVVVC